MWALGVITYFLLCGYTPFDRQNSMDEMHAILNAEYQFAPIEYWQGVSETGRREKKKTILPQILPFHVLTRAYSPLCFFFLNVLL
jgi:serine/threonine protein kinase